MKFLRILFTILSAICIAAVLPVGALLSWTWAGIFGVFAFAFYGLMRIFKMEQEKKENSIKPDYITNSDSSSDINSPSKDKQ